MPRVSLCVPALALAGGLAAQAFTSPAGMAFTEGNTSFNHFSATTTLNARRFQQIDHTQVGTPALITGLGWRRDGGASGGGSNDGPRTMTLEITLGGTSMSQVSSDYELNFTPGLRTLVFTPKLVNMPDWNGNAGTPAPFDFGVTFDTPFGYPGTWDLVIDFTYSNLAYLDGTTPGGSSLDREFGSDNSSSGTTVGTGCVATGQTGTFVHNAVMENSGPSMPNFGMRLRVDGSRGPANAPLLLYIDAVNSNVSLPGLCGVLHALPTISLNASATDSTGDVPYTMYSFGYIPALVGATFYSQLIALDLGRTGFPVALSNAERTSMPAFTLSSAGVEAMYHWDSLPATINNLLNFGGGVVMQLRR